MNFEPTNSCLNCGSAIYGGARVCPYCHLDPLDTNATIPYAHLGSDSDDPTIKGTAGCIVVGTLLLPLCPVVGAPLLGLAAVGMWKIWRGK